VLLQVPVSCVALAVDVALENLKMVFLDCFLEVRERSLFPVHATQQMLG
jgi:hypothetical protein